MSEGFSDLPAAMKNAVQNVVTEFAGPLGGASLVGDVIVLIEAHCSDGRTVLRQIDCGVPSWRQLGMLLSAQQTLQTEEITTALYLAGENE